MGQTLSEPVTEKVSGEGQDERLIYAFSSMQGWRITMEDAHTTILRLKGQERVSFFAVFDGHGGSSTAKFAGKAMHKRLESDPAFKESDYVAALKNTFLGTDADLKNDPDFKHDPSGCTAVAVLVTDDKIYCSNAGDSRAVMSVGGTVEALSQDHKPMNLAETQRIVNAGGFVEFGRVNGNLALSRALGDFEFKKNISLPPEKQIVTADPDIAEHIITPEDEFVVIACDGIWDCMTSQNVVTVVRQEIANKTPLDRICEKIMDDCLADDADAGTYGCDNMTIVIVGLLGGRTREEWYDWVARRERASAVSGDSFSSAASTLVPSAAGAGGREEGLEDQQQRLLAADVDMELEPDVAPAATGPTGAPVAEPSDENRPAEGASAAEKPRGSAAGSRT